MDTTKKIKIYNLEKVYKNFIDSGSTPNDYLNIFYTADYKDKKLIFKSLYEYNTVLCNLIIKTFYDGVGYVI